MSNPLLVSTFLASKRKAIEEFQAHCGPPEVSFVKGKRPFSSIVHETRSFKPFKFSRTARKSVKETKLASRQSRRRHSLVQESDEAKLRTHQWTAKRMHLENVDGHMVAQTSNRRSVKSTARLYDRQSAILVNDSSYLQLLEVQGNLDILLDTFAQSTDTECAFFATLATGKIFESRTPCVEYDVLLHEKGRFPVGLIGPCKILCQPIDGESDEIESSRRVKCWIWYHPGISNAVTGLFNETEGLQSTILKNTDRIELFGESSQNALLALLAYDTTEEPHTTPALPFLHQSLKAPHSSLKNVWRHNYVLPVTIRDPRLGSAATDVNSPHLKVSNSNNQSKLKWPNRARVAESALWSQSPTSMSPSPASDYAINSAKQQAKNHALETLCQVLQPTTFSTSNANQTKKEDTHDLQSLNALCSLLLVRHHCSSTSTSHHSPAQSASAPSLSERCLTGWTLMVPRSWTRVIWQVLVTRGRALPVGTQELDYLRRAQGIVSFPRDYLDCNLGWQQYQDQLESLQRKEDAKPLGKRIQWPFHVCAQLRSDVFHEQTPIQMNEQLDVPAEEGQETTMAIGSEVGVVRKPMYLQHFVMPALSSERSSINDPEWRRNICESHIDWTYGLRGPESDNSFPAQEHLVPPLPSLQQPTYLHCLIRPTGRGNPHNFAVILRPTARDLQTFLMHHLQRKAKRQQSKNQIEPPGSTMETVDQAEGREAMTTAARKKQQKKQRQLQQLLQLTDGLLKHTDLSLSEQRSKTSIVDQKLLCSTAWRGVELSSSAGQSYSAEKTVHESDDTESEKDEDDDDQEDNDEEKEDDDSGKYTVDDFQRTVLGTVTSGDDARGSNSRLALALCRADALYEAQRSQYLRCDHPLAHRLVLFQNPGSSMLRPALLDIMI